MNFYNQLKSQKYNLVLLDQIIISGSNFLVTILIINFIGLEKFGLFSFLWLIYLLINTFQLSFIISPMMTNSNLYKDISKKYYYGGVFTQQIFLSILSIIMIKIFFSLEGLIKINKEISNLQNIFILIIFFSQIYQFLRRYFFSEKLYINSIILDIIVNCILLFFLVYYFQLGKLNLNNLFFCYLISFCFGAIAVLFFIKKLKFSYETFFNSIKMNYKISKWLTLTSILQWFSGNLWILNSGIILGAYILGAIRACQTIVNICNLIFQSLENYFPSKITEIYKIKGSIIMNNYIKKINIVGFLMISLFVLIVSISSKPILNLFYNIEIAKFYYLLIFFSILLPFTFINFFYNFGLRTLMNTKPIFLSYLFSSFFSISLSSYIITNYQEKGFIFGLVLTQLIVLFFTYNGYRKTLNSFKKI